MANPITIVNVTQQQAPAPSVLQRSGALISQGATTNAVNSLTLLPTPATLATMLTGSKAITSITQTAGLATVATTAAHGLPMGETIELTIAGSTILAYNGTFACTVTGASAFTYAVPSGTASPATGTITYTLEDVAELTAMNSTFFVQTGFKSVYVLELGPADPADGIVALATWIAANPGRIYSYLTPIEWDGDSTFVPFLRTFVALDAKTYFFVTTTQAHEALYAGIKSVIALVPSPTALSSEFGAAGPFSGTLGWNPSSTQQVPPLEYQFLAGITPWSPYGNQSAFTGFATNNINYAGTGAEGGISNVILFGGNTQDGNPFNYWYSVDWAAINTDLSISNAVINGSNSAPYLYYNQQGINRLQAVALSVMRQAVSYGLANGTVIGTQLPYVKFAENFNNGLYDGQIVVNAEPYTVYTQENPSDYSIGKYAGLALAYTPLRGFDQIIVNLNATTFPNA
jgi:hypothetical protein